MKPQELNTDGQWIGLSPPISRLLPPLPPKVRRFNSTSSQFVIYGEYGQNEGRKQFVQ
jgi:hypothetical protein